MSGECFRAMDGTPQQHFDGISPLKRCPDCGESKPFDDFPKNKRTRDGRAVCCKLSTTREAERLLLASTAGVGTTT